MYYKGAKEAPYSFMNADARHLLVNRPVLICVKSGNECNGVHEEGLRNTVHLFVFNITVIWYLPRDCSSYDHFKPGPFRYTVHGIRKDNNFCFWNNF
jgi:hypothetical protein